jgi:hypothetical protein
MKKAIVFGLLSLSIVAHAQNWADPEAKFDITKNLVEQIDVKIRAVDNVQQICEAESKKRGMGGFGYSVNACSFWNGNKCTIIVPKKTSLHTLGHEFRHCAQGSFH